jgi:hypothetical protein
MQDDHETVRMKRPRSGRLSYLIFGFDSGMKEQWPRLWECGISLGL